MQHELRAPAAPLGPYSSQFAVGFAVAQAMQSAEGVSRAPCAHLTRKFVLVFARAAWSGIRLSVIYRIM